MLLPVTLALTAALFSSAHVWIGAVNLAQVVDAGVFLRLGAGPDEVGNGDRGQQANDGDNDHNFHQREPLFARCSVFHSNFAFLSLAA